MSSTKDKDTLSTWDIVTAPIWVPYYMVLATSTLVLAWTTPNRQSSNKDRNNGVYKPSVKDKVLDTAGNIAFTQWNKGNVENK